ncbi:hypothetical protein BE20_04085 [Sorangium cellulosum]|uniref:ABC transporter permease n=1 Tax=Sorangium cellulosum TaxID=56 RepID=A0A150SDF9_SORCE|nr:hypothetical protein BE18_45870 [Sorangium cellulosum]KYF97390.1 hypothetical protein BE20_04085 [Sorangium cellulosum]
MTQLILVTLNGLTRGALIFLVASGFTLVFGVMRLVNLAHGALCLIGAYAAHSILEATGSWALAVLLAPLVTVVAGLALERTVLRPTKGSDMRQALVTIGAGIVIADQLLAQYGGHTVDVTPPPAIDGSTSVAGVVYPTLRLATMAAAVLVGVALWLLIQRTRLGRLVRAGIDDRDMVAALGIDVDAWLVRRVVRTPFGLTLQGIRDNPRRMRTLGFNVAAYRVAAFTLAGFVAAVGGVLGVWYNGSISPGGDRHVPDRGHGGDRGRRRPRAPGGRVPRSAVVHAGHQLRQLVYGPLQHAHRADLPRGHPVPPRGAGGRRAPSNGQI